MPINYQPSLEKAKSTIANAPDSILRKLNFHESVYKSSEIHAPILDTEKKAKPKIVNELVDLQSHNVPSGVMFTPGRMYEFGVFDIPVNGNKSLLNEIFSRHYRNREVDFSMGFMRIKIFHPSQITNNDAAISQVGGTAKVIVDEINKALTDAKKSIDDFNENQLMPFIKDEIAKEIKRRDDKNGSIDKLDKFF